MLAPIPRSMLKSTKKNKDFHYLQGNKSKHVPSDLEHVECRYCHIEPIKTICSSFKPWVSGILLALQRWAEILYVAFSFANAWLA